VLIGRTHVCACAWSRLPQRTALNHLRSRLKTAEEGLKLCQRKAKELNGQCSEGGSGVTDTHADDALQPHARL
jgi:hypothetical protein